jgi:hypothetical protein
MQSKETQWLNLQCSWSFWGVEEINLKRLVVFKNTMKSLELKRW